MTKPAIIKARCRQCDTCTEVTGDSVELLLILEDAPGSLLWQCPSCGPQVFLTDPCTTWVLLQAGVATRHVLSNGELASLREFTTDLPRILDGILDGAA